MKLKDASFLIRIYYFLLRNNKATHTYAVNLFSIHICLNRVTYHVHTPTEIRKDTEM